MNPAETRDPRLELSSEGRRHLDYKAAVNTATGFLLAIGIVELSCAWVGAGLLRNTLALWAGNDTVPGLPMLPVTHAVAFLVHIAAVTLIVVGCLHYTKTRAAWIPLSIGIILVLLMSYGASYRVAEYTGVYDFGNFAMGVLEFALVGLPVILLFVDIKHLNDVKTKLRYVEDQYSNQIREERGLIAGKWVIRDQIKLLEQRRSFLVSEETSLVTRLQSLGREGLYPQEVVDLLSRTRVNIVTTDTELSEKRRMLGETAPPAPVLQEVEAVPNTSFTMEGCNEVQVDS